MNPTTQRRIQRGTFSTTTTTTTTTMELSENHDDGRHYGVVDNCIIQHQHQQQNIQPLPQDDTWLELNDMDEDSISSFDAVLDGIDGTMTTTTTTTNTTTSAAAAAATNDNQNPSDNDPYDHHYSSPIRISRDQFIHDEEELMDNLTLASSSSATSDIHGFADYPNASSSERSERSNVPSTTTTTTGKSFDQLMMVAAAANAESLTNQSTEKPASLSSSSTTKARKRGGKAMRLIFSQKRFKAQQRRCQRSLAYRPLLDLPTDISTSILSFLDVPSLMTVRCLCRKANILASRDDSGWKMHSTKLWRNKVHVSENARYLLTQTGKAMEAYMESVKDAQCRQHVTPTELCYDPVTQSGTIWSFRFKASAGPSWTQLDPWYDGRDARQLVFLHDGTMQQLVYEPAGSSTPKLIPPFSDQFQEQQQQVDGGDNPQQRQRQPQQQPMEQQGRPIVMTWRYISQPLDSPSRPKGSYIRVSVNGRDVPTYICQRAPTKCQNWGFILDSLWGVFTSFTLPRRRQVMRLRRDSNGTARWFNVDGMESDDDDDDESDGEAHDDDGGDDKTNNSHHRNSNHLGRALSDSNLPTTNKVQWREALMYNVGGCRLLPEGEGARIEFDKLFMSYGMYPTSK